jgi:hypothetical protein
VQSEKAEIFQIGKTNIINQKIMDKWGIAKIALPLYFFVLTKFDIIKQITCVDLIDDFSSDVSNELRTGNISQPSLQRWDIEYIGIECLNRVFIQWKLLEV